MSVTIPELELMVPHASASSGQSVLLTTTKRKFLATAGLSTRPKSEEIPSAGLLLAPGVAENMISSTACVGFGRHGSTPLGRSRQRLGH